MICYRITRIKYADQPLSGEGARRFGGRWNSPGTAVVYAAQSKELAILELLVHWNHYALIPEMVLTAYEISDSLTFSKPEFLPTGWDDPMFYHPQTQKFGDKFVKDHKTLCAIVPSVIVPTSHNIIINPGHPDAEGITIKQSPFQFDPRLTTGLK